MKCQECGPEIFLTAKQVECCWCKAELCNAHMAEHVQGCAYYKSSTCIEAPKRLERAERVFKGKRGFEAFGKIAKRMGAA